MAVLLRIFWSVILPVLVTLIALWADRWLLRGKRLEAAKQEEKEKLLKELSEMQELVHEVLQKLAEISAVPLEKDRLSRRWRMLEKRIPKSEKMKLENSYQNACSKLSCGGLDARQGLDAFQNALEGVYKRAMEER